MGFGGFGVWGLGFGGLGVQGLGFRRKLCITRVVGPQGLLKWLFGMLVSEVTGDQKSFMQGPGRLEYAWGDRPYLLIHTMLFVNTNNNYSAS